MRSAGAGHEVSSTHRLPDALRGGAVHVEVADNLGSTSKTVYYICQGKISILGFI